VRWYEQGLIYRGKRLVNWDPVLKTAMSDLEVESAEEDGFLWSIAYTLDDGLSYERRARCRRRGNRDPRLPGRPPPARKPCWATPR
jgi:hypothetical protein